MLKIRPLPAKPQWIFPVLLAILLPFCSAFAQSHVKITGYVRDASTGAPLIGANIQVMNTALGAATDNLGAFYIEGLPLGEYTLKVSYIGYKTQIKTQVKVQEDYITRRDFYLLAAPVELNEINVTARRISLSTYMSSQNTVILSNEDLAGTNAINIAEALENLPGIQILSSGGASSEKSASIRGGAANQTLILIDGQRIDSGQNDSIDLSNLPVSIVESIEIAKGNLSSVFGPNAVQGVINIITKSSAGDFPYNARVLTGSFGERIVGADAAGDISSLKYLVSLEKGNYSGNYEFTDPRGEIRNRENSFKNHTNLFGKLSKTSEKYHLQAQYYMYSSDRGLPGIVYQETPEAVSDYAKHIISGAGNIIFNRNLFLNINASYNHNSTININRTGFQYNTESKNKTYLFELNQRFVLDQFNSIHAGFAYKKDILNHKDNNRVLFSIGEKRQDLKSLFIAGETGIPVPHIFDRLTFNAAARYDRHSRISSQFSPRAGAALIRGGKYHLALRFNYGRSYRPPNFNDMYYEGYRVVGNPDLLPERSRGGDAGVNFSAPVYGRIRAEFNYFRNVIDDIILWRKRFDGIFTPYNLSRSILFGSETSLEWRLPGNILELSASHSFTRAVNKSGERTTDGRQLPNRPVHTTFLRITANYRVLSTGIKFRDVSERFIREANTKPMAPYSVYDVWLSWNTDLSKIDFTTNFSIYNIFNEEYMVLERAPIPGRVYRLNVSLKFKLKEKQE